MTLSANQGIKEAQTTLGLMYLEGQGTSQNAQEAIKWLTCAANQNSIEAQRILGLTYCMGKVIPQDRAAARKWLMHAAEQGDGDAQFRQEREVKFYLDTQPYIEG